MKKILFTALLLLLLFCSCHSGAAGRDSSVSSVKSGTDRAANSSSAGAVGGEVKAREITAGKLLKLDNPSNLIGLYGNSVIYDKEINKQNDTADQVYYCYNIDKAQSKELGRIKTVNASSGDYLVMNGQYLYNTAYILTKEPYSLFVGLSLTGGKEKTIAKEKLYPPLQYYARLNENEFIKFGPNLIKGTQNSYDYYIKIYNTSTNEVRPVVSSSYDGATQRGKAMISAACRDGKIYVYTVKTEQNANAYSVDVYDASGKLLNTLPLRNLGEKLAADRNGGTEDGVLHMSLYGNFFIFKTLNNHFLIYQYKNGSLNITDHGNQLDYNTLVLSIGPVSTDNKKVYFCDHKNNLLNIFDSGSGMIRAVKINVDGKFSYIESCITDGEGNIAVQMSSTKEYKDNAGYRYYYIPKEEILAALK